MTSENLAVSIADGNVQMGTIAGESSVQGDDLQGPVENGSLISVCKTDRRLGKASNSGQKTRGRPVMAQHQFIELALQVLTRTKSVGKGLHPFSIR